MFDVKITVMKIAKHKDLIKKYENPIKHACDMKERMIFISKEGKMPNGFCISAWESIFPFLIKLANGTGNFYDGWMKDPMSAMISCNDGFRPVSFYLEVINNKEDVRI